MVNLVRAAALSKYAEVARQYGLNPVSLLRKHSMSLRLIADPERRIPILPVLALLEESAQLADCPGFGLRMAESRQLADMGGISLLLTHQRTVGDAVRTLIEYHDAFNPSLSLSIEQAGKSVVVRSQLLTGGATHSVQGDELLVGVLYLMCKALLGAQWRPCGVQFSHAAPADLRVHRRVFACPLEFGREFNGMIMSAADLALMNPRGDPSMARFAQRFLDSTVGAKKTPEYSIVREVRKAIYLMLPAGRATIEQIAAGMGVNLRTLQRHLEEAGVTFSGLLDEVRGELVLRYLEDRELPLARIAELLGYRMPSSFTRWFNAQFGMAPVAWRRTLTRRG
ncbi:MAG: AraC family transcriptional regulator [Gammaproteobacteria bacterium]|nr:AraC family transcriptional regulator [Gammaproteobacteria bacterium]